MNGVIVIDKPQDYTSFDVVAVVRGIFETKKVGHTGTLDPMATGVLPILLGSATKALSLLPDTDKEYRASFLFGKRTDTLDITGKALEERKSSVTAEQLLDVLPQFRGSIMQLPPMYSAVSVGGKRLYELAREGKEVERKPREVNISALELLSFDTDRQCGELLVRCSKGTYIRTLIDDIATQLGTIGVMSALRRASACGFKLDQAVPLAELRSLKAEKGLEGAAALVHPVETLFSDYCAVSVSEAQAKRFSNGGSLDLMRTQLKNKAVADGEVFRVCERGGGFLGLARADSGELKFLKKF